MKKSMFKSSQQFLPSNISCFVKLSVDYNERIYATDFLLELRIEYTNGMESILDERQSL
jgi:hypothetical protein